MSECKQKSYTVNGVTFATRVLPTGIEMMETTVTVALWNAVMGSGKEGAPGLPVTDVSWRDASRFAAALNSELGLDFALPSEADWESACNAGEDPIDDDDKIMQAAWVYENSDDRLHAVATKKPNAWGLYDMLGNVWEWCTDEYS